MAKKERKGDSVFTRRKFLNRACSSAGAFGLAGGAMSFLSSCAGADDLAVSPLPKHAVNVPRTVADNRSKPNIIFILTDDHRYDHFSCTGHPFLRTPHLDRIANEGVRFENAFVTTSLCSPSRASFLTGQYAHTHGVVTNHTPWQDNSVTFLEYMKAAGYDTAFIGKWHMPGEGLPNLRGVDRFISFTEEGGQGIYNNCPLIIDGIDTPRPGKYITEDLTDFALEFMSRERRNPFCLYLSHKAVHFGYRPPAHLDHLYDGVDLHLPPESNTFIPFTNNQMFVGAPFPMDFMYRNYCECIVSVDEQAGRVLAALENSGKLDSTVIIYAGDNGHFWGEHGLYDKRLAYEESIRIPLFMRYPGLIPKTGRCVPRMALNIDLAPTLLDLLGIPVPGYMQGESLVPLLRNTAAPGRERWLYEHFPVFPIPIPGITAVRTPKYKYIEYRNDVRPRELYDLESDPREMNNLIRTARGRTLQPALKRELEDLKHSTGYRFISHG